MTGSKVYVYEAFVYRDGGKKLFLIVRLTGHLGFVLEALSDLAASCRLSTKSARRFHTHLMIMIYIVPSND